MVFLGPSGPALYLVLPLQQPHGVDVIIPILQKKEMEAAARLKSMIC